MPLPQAEAAVLWARDIYFKPDIRMHGLRQKLICLPDGTLADGYTRHKILGELGVPITPDMVEIRDIPEDKIKEEVFAINIARRHLPKITEIEWAKRYVPVFKERKKRGPKPKTNNWGVPAPPNSETDQPGDTHSTRKKQAKTAGVGVKQLQQYNWCEKWIPELLAEVSCVSHWGLL